MLKLLLSVPYIRQLTFGREEHVVVRVLRVKRLRYTCSSLCKLVTIAHTLPTFSLLFHLVLFAHTSSSFRFFSHHFIASTFNFSVRITDLGMPLSLSSGVHCPAHSFTFFHFISFFPFTVHLLAHSFIHLVVSTTFVHFRLIE